MKIVKTTSEYDRWEEGLRDRAAVARIRVRIRRLSLGNPGQHRVLKAGVVEMKIDNGPGFRVYFTERAGQIIVLLCSGTQKRQNADIEQAVNLATSLDG